MTISITGTALCAALFCTAAAKCDQSIPPVRLPEGVTYLGDVGMYRVAYQSYGGKVVEMPPGWSGHFETVSGISYKPGGRLLNRRALLLHSPWRIEPGKVWVDYPLTLPRTTPISLRFGIAMKPEMVGPKRSDGVTFSAWLRPAPDAPFTPLMREHWRQGKWKGFSFDLSKYAGHTVVARLQTEPGPANNPNFDYSYFGDARIRCGKTVADFAKHVQEFTATRAYRAAEKADLRRLANRSDQSVVPGCLFDGGTFIEHRNSAYVLRYRGPDCSIAYTWRPRTGTLDDVTAAIDAGRPFRPLAGGGVSFAGPDGQPKARAEGGNASSIRLDPNGRGFHVIWHYPTPDGTVAVEWHFGIRGKALTVTVRCEVRKVTRFSLGGVADAALRRRIDVPYMPVGRLDYLPEDRTFVCRYLDWTVSNASRCPQDEAVYERRTDGVRNPLLESGYVAVSPCVDEVLPNLPNPPSPFIGVLGDRIMLDIWRHHRNTYEGDAENLLALKDNGVDHLAIIQHVWQRYGYDVKLPDHIPANPTWGGDTGMIAFGKAANHCEYVWSVHENYIDLYPDAPSYDPTARVLREDGTPSPAWFNRGTGVQSYGLKCNRALGYAKQNSPYIHKTYGTTAAYLDVHTCVPPWHQLDHEAGQPLAAMARAKVQFDTQLFQYMRDTHGGPLFGEGNNQAYWAGKCDGCEAQVRGGEDHEPFLDFDLLKLHPQMVNHGMGYYERWFRQGYNTQWGRQAASPEQIDKYRAQELAYGHAGFIGNNSTDNIQWVAKEHHIMHAVQALYGNSRVMDIRYEIGGQWVTGSAALAFGRRLRQRIRYDSGLTLWVNWAPELWAVEGRILPQWGFLALGPDTEAWTARVDGKIADWVDCPEYLFADARTSFEMPYIRNKLDVEPRLREFKDLGDGRFRVTYEWIVKQKLPSDAHCFVHFLNEAAPDSQDIVFQQDHALPTPCTTWRPGQTIVDGPYEIQVPADKPYNQYDWVIGLYNKKGRLPLGGVRMGDRRTIIARLEIERRGSRVVRARLADFAALCKRLEVDRVDFSAHLNPPGTLVRFDKLATDGSVKINKGKRSFVIFPCPRDRKFRVELDLMRLAPGAAAHRPRLRALAALTQQDMGPVPFSTDRGRLTFEAGRTGVGRYVLKW